MATMRVFLNVYDNKRDKHPQYIMLGWMDSKDKEKFLSKVTSTKFIEQSCFSDVKYTLNSEYHELSIQAFLKPQKLAKCSTFAGCAWGCIRNMVEACAKEHKRFWACENKPVVNMLFKNKLILDNKQNIK